MGWVRINTVKKVITIVVKDYGEYNYVSIILNVKHINFDRIHM